MDESQEPMEDDDEVVEVGSGSKVTKESLVFFGDGKTPRN